MALLQCLLTGAPVSMASLPGDDRPVAALLAEARILSYESSTDLVGGDRYQLISAFGLSLLIDRRIHFGPDLHEIYIGPDSYAMLFYIDTAKIDRHSRVLDMCTGSGISALYLSQYSDHVTATDIGPEPLALARYNIALNGRGDAITLRNQKLEETLALGEKFDVLTCNPPFVAMPPGHPGMLYATGPGIDGLDYVRQIIASLPQVLNPGGVAYIVADLIGGSAGPFLLDELKKFAETGRLQIDAIVDAVLPVAIQAKAMASLIAATGEGTAATHPQDEVNAFYYDTLRVENFYLTTLKIRTAQPKGALRMLHRDLLPQFVDAPKWPALLRQ